MKTFSHSFTLPGHPETHLWRFTAKGEEAWVPGWRPRYLHPESGDTRHEMLWQTGGGDDLTYWCCLAWEPDLLHARYLRLMPAKQISFVDVRLAPDEAGTRVTVGYEHHPLTGAAKAALDAQTPDDFARSIDGWRELILAA